MTPNKLPGSPGVYLRRPKKRPISAFVAACALSLTATVAFGQETAESEPSDTTSPQNSQSNTETTTPIVELEAYQVVGVRGSLIGAQEIKQTSRQFVDAIVAEDIGKLPDNTVSDALQRVPGIQVARDNGEVNSVVIRGLPNLATTVNGNEIFTGTNRGVSLQDLPADLVSRVDVYKSSSPEQLEGGIAGLIDIRLRRPLDFKEGLQFAASGRYIHGENAEKDSLVGSALVSNQWDLSNGGKFGVLFAASYQNIHFSDQRVFNFLWEPVSPVDPDLPLAPGSEGHTSIDLPVTAGSLLTPGDRRRPAFNFSMQWKPSNNLELYSDFLFTGYRNRHEVYFFIGFPRDGQLFSTAQSIELVPGSAVARKIVTTPANFQLTSTQAFDDRTDGYQWVGGGKWRTDKVTFTGEVTYNWNKIENRGVIVDTQFAPADPATFTFELNTPHGTNVTVDGADITDGDNFRFWGLFDNRNHASGEQTAVKLDMDYTVPRGFFTDVKTGIRLSDRDVMSRASARNDIPPVDGRGVKVTTTVPGFGGPAPDGLFSTGQFGASHWYGGDPDFQLDNADTVRGIFGFPAGPPPFDPASTFNDTEKTYAVYGQAGFNTDINDKTFDGLFGVRIVKTKQSLEGFSSAGTRITRDRDQTDVLPSLNARLKLTGNVQMRLSAGRAITRPNFIDLNPVVALFGPTTTGGADGTGTGGNPDLKDVKSDNIDLSIENYFAKSSYVSLTGFYRRIDGYVQTFASREDINGTNYIVTRPRNTGKGHLNGFEATYQQFFDSLPGPFRGFGVQLNYTYITGNTDAPDTSPGAAVGALVTRPYAQVSKSSYNVIGIYERDNFSARLAYNHRGEYVDTFDGPNAPGSPLRTITVKPTDRVDFSASYRFNENFTLTFDVTNLLNSKYQDYFYDSSLYQRDTRLYDRTWELGARYRF